MGKKKEQKAAPKAKGPSVEERLTEIEGDIYRLAVELGDMFGGTLQVKAMEIAKKRQGKA